VQENFTQRREELEFPSPLRPSWPKKEEEKKLFVQTWQNFNSKPLDLSYETTSNRSSNN